MSGVDAAAAMDRLQIGTTSQAHSAMLCQRMRMIAQSCAAIGDIMVAR